MVRMYARACFDAHKEPDRAAAIGGHDRGAAPRMANVGGCKMRTWRPWRQMAHLALAERCTLVVYLLGRDKVAEQGVLGCPLCPMRDGGRWVVGGGVTGSYIVHRRVRRTLELTGRCSFPRSVELPSASFLSRLAQREVHRHLQRAACSVQCAVWLVHRPYNANVFGSR